MVDTAGQMITRLVTIETFLSTTNFIHIFSFHNFPGTLFHFDCLDDLLVCNLNHLRSLLVRLMNDSLVAKLIFNVILT